MLKSRVCLGVQTYSQNIPGLVRRWGGDCYQWLGEDDSVPPRELGAAGQLRGWQVCRDSVQSRPKCLKPLDLSDSAPCFTHMRLRTGAPWNDTVFLLGSLHHALEAPGRCDLTASVKGLTHLPQRFADT